MSVLEPFLREAMKTGVRVDVGLLSGKEFKAVTIGGLLDGTVELRHTVRRGANQHINATKQYVVAIHSICWGVVS